MSLPKNRIELTDEQFKRINVAANLLALKGAFTAILSEQADKDKHAADIAAFEARAIPNWAKPINWNKANINTKWNSVAGMSKIALGVSFDYAKTLGDILQAGDCFIKIVENELGLVKVDGVIKVAVNVERYKSQAVSLLSRVNKKQISEAIVKQSSEADFWYIVEELLKEEVTIDLVGLLTARMLMPKDMRDSLDKDLAAMDVFKNKQGKLAQSVIRLIGYVGLATVTGDPVMAQHLKFIKNPLLGEDVVDRAIVKRSDETAEKFKARQEAHTTGFAAYKTIMTEMKKHQEHYNNIPKETKDRIKAQVKSWCGGEIML